MESDLMRQKKSIRWLLLGLAALVLLVVELIAYSRKSPPDVARALASDQSNALSLKHAADNAVTADSTPMAPAVATSTTFADKKMTNILTKFNQWRQKFQSEADPGQKAKLLSQGIELAKRRKVALSKMIENSPADVFQNVLPPLAIKSLPETVRAHLESHVETMGTYEVIHTCGGEGNVCRIERFVKAHGKRYQAYVYGRRLEQTTKFNMPIRGVALDEKIALHHRPLRVIKKLGKGNASSSLQAIVGGLTKSFKDQNDLYAYEKGQTAAEMRVGPRMTADLDEPNPWTHGHKKVLFIRVDFSDMAGEPISEGSARNLVDNTVNNFFKDNSYNKTSMSADVTPVLRMPETKAFYLANGRHRLWSAAENEAKANGYDLADYDRWIIGFKRIYSGWAGVAYVGGQSFMLNGYWGLREAAHEMGHNYGLYHANYWKTNENLDPIGTGGSEEYGDSFDTMGGSSGNSAKHFNVAYKSKLEWLGTAEAPEITTSGTYTIHAHDQGILGGLTALNVPRVDRESIWVGFRQRFTSNKWLSNGAALHWTQWSSSYLLDTTQGSANGKNDAALVLGRTYSDVTAGIHITPTILYAGTPKSMDVVVNLGHFEDNQAPGLTVVASTTTAAVGETITFTANAADPDGDDLAFYWDFGNGNFGTNSPNANRSWSSEGAQTVRCIVSDMKGGLASQTLIVSVGAVTTFRLAGQATLGATPLQGVKISGAGQTTLTDSDGRFILANVASGSHALTAAKFGYSINPSGFSNPLAVNADIAGIDFNASLKTYSLSGYATDNGNRLPGVTIQTNSLNTTTDGNGEFTLGNLPNGMYSVSASYLDWEVFAAWVYPYQPSAMIEVRGGNVTYKYFNRKYWQTSGRVLGVPESSPILIRTSDESYSTTGYFQSNAWNYHLSLPKGTFTLEALSTGYTLIPDTFSNPLTMDQDYPTLDFKAIGTNTLPTITAIPDQIINENTATPPLAFVIGDAETPAATLAVYANANNSVLVPASGLSLSGSGTHRSLVVTPAANQIGSSQITVTVVDGGGASASASFNLTVQDLNLPPIADNAIITTNEDTAKALTLTGSDPDGDPITFKLLDAPGHGSLSGTPPNLIYTPAPDYNGPDQFTFETSDGTLHSIKGTVSVTVNPVNDEPSILSGPMATPNPAQVGQQVAFHASATDLDGDLLSYSWSFGDGMTGVGTDPNHAYSVAGTYTATITVTDGEGGSAQASIIVLVETPVYQIKVDVAGSLNSYTLSSYAGSQDQNPSLSTENDERALRINGNGWKKIPLPYAVTAGTVLEFDFQSSAQGEIHGIGFSKTNSLSSSTIFKLYGTQNWGILTHNTYAGSAPETKHYKIQVGQHYNGAYSYLIFSNDHDITNPTAESVFSNIKISEVPVNQPPVANPMTLSTNEDQPKTFSLNAMDPDDDPLSYVLLSGPSHGTLSGTGANRTYQPTAHYYGSDSFTYKVNDGQDDSNVATVQITIVSVNDAPVALNGTHTTSEDTPLAVTLQATDFEGDALTYSVVGNPGQGVLTGTPPNLTYHPNSDFHGSDLFLFKANDGTADSNVATISLTIQSINDAPIAQNVNVSTDEDTSVAFLLNGTDPDGDPLTYNVLAGPSNGTLSGTGSNLTYTPNPNFNGSDSITYHTHDGTVNSNSALVTISVRSVNDAPLAIATANPTSGQAPLTISFDGSNSSDPDGTLTTYAWDFGDGQSGNGAMANHVYTSAGTFTALLTVTDEDNASDTTSIVISVTAQPAADKLAYTNLSQAASHTYNYTMGTQFQINQPIRITEIIVDGLLNGTNDNVGLWLDGATAPLATFSMTTGVTPQNVAVSTDILIEPGTYRLAGTFKSYRYTPVSSLVESPEVDVLGGTWTSGNSLVYPTNFTTYAIYGQVNFRFIPLTSSPNKAPLAFAAAWPQEGSTPHPVTFDGSDSHDPDGQIISREWDFGDGQKGSGSRVTHTYHYGGTYIATLTVTDNNGKQASDTVTIFVSTSNNAAPAYRNLREMAAYNLDYVLGTRFAVSKKIRLKRVWVDSRLNGTSNNVGLWKDGATAPMATFSITSHPDNGEGSTDTDLVLEPGIYRLAGTFKQYKYTPVSELTSAPQITVLNGTYSSGTALVYPTAISSYIYGHVNFDLVPED